MAKTKASAADELQKRTDEWEYFIGEVRQKILEELYPEFAKLIAKRDEELAQEMQQLGKQQTDLQKYLADVAKKARADDDALRIEILEETAGIALQRLSEFKDGFSLELAEIMRQIQLFKEDMSRAMNQFAKSIERDLESLKASFIRQLTELSKKAESDDTNFQRQIVDIKESIAKRTSNLDNLINCQIAGLKKTCEIEDDRIAKELQTTSQRLTATLDDFKTLLDHRLKAKFDRAQVQLAEFQDKSETVAKCVSELQNKFSRNTWALFILSALSSGLIVAVIAKIFL